MAITHSTAMRNTLADAVDNYINSTGSATAAGLMVFQNAAGSVLAQIALENPAFGAASAGQVSLSMGAGKSSTNAQSSSDSTCTKFEIRERDGNAVIFGSVGTTGSDINLSSTTIGTGDTVTISSLTYTAPA